MSIEDRLSELEIKASYAEDLLDALNKTIFRQQQKIELLEDQVRHLHQQLQAAQPAEPLSPRDEIPPHY